MLFSVIIPAYNAERTISRCLESLLEQPHDDSEIIVVNDGSTDNTGEICKLYAKQFPELRYISKENGGVSSARNMGLKAAMGEYVLFVDSDDYVLEGYFDELREYKDIDLLVYGSRIQRGFKFKNRSVDRELIHCVQSFSFIKRMLRLRDGSPCNKRFRRLIIENNNILFPETLYIGEDFIFGLEYMLKASSMAAIDRCIYNVDASSISLTRRYKADVVQQSMEIYRLAFQLLNTSAMNYQSNKQLAQIIDYNYCRTAFACVQEILKNEIESYRRCREEIKSTLQAFKRNRNKFGGTVGLAHIAMGICIEKQMGSIVYAIARVKLSYEAFTTRLTTK